MAFSWNTPAVSSGVKLSMTMDETIAELKDNIDHVYGQQGHPAWSWTEIPVSSGSYIESVDISELRGATDHIHGNLDCISDCTADYLSYDFVHYGTDDATHNSTHDGSHLHGVLSTYYAQHDGTDRSSYCATYQPGALTSDCNSVCGTHYSSYKSGVETKYNGNNLTGLKSYNHPAHYNGWQGSHVVGQNATIQSGYNAGGGD